MIKNCIICNKEYKKDYTISLKQWAKSKFCSPKCHGIYNIKMGIKPPPRTGIVPWNKGKPNLKFRGEGNPKWVGDNVTYHALHSWVARWLGKATECVYCGKDKFDGLITWASVSHHAKRDLSDYISLCMACHKEYDKKVRI